MFRTFSAIFHHGEANRDAFNEIHALAAHGLHVIPHGDEAMFANGKDDGGDLRRQYGIDGDRPVAVFFGGLRPSKGIEDLVEAFALARSEIAATLVIAGHPSGVDPTALVDQAVRLGIADDVVVDPRYVPMDDVGRLIRTGDVVASMYSRHVRILRL